MCCCGRGQQENFSYLKRSTWKTINITFNVHYSWSIFATRLCCQATFSDGKPSYKPNITLLQPTKLQRHNKSFYPAEHRNCWFTAAAICLCYWVVLVNLSLLFHGYFIVILLDSVFILLLSTTVTMFWKVQNQMYICIFNPKSSI